MFRLVLNAPFGIVLVHRSLFETEGGAQDWAGTLPQGFKVVPDDDVPQHAIPVPIRMTKDTTMRPEELKRYDDACKQPIQMGDTVYVISLKERAIVVGLADNQVQVRLPAADQSQTISLAHSEVVRVGSWY